MTTPTIESLLLAMADDELVLGHRNAEWTGHSPILEEDIAFSNIAQDEIGHALIWYTAYEKLAGRSPDQMAFERPWNEFTCARFVTYPKGDFAYTVVRQFFFDVAEEVRLRSFLASSSEVLRSSAAKILKEEAYHRLHTQGLVERLGDATEESRRRMQAGVTAAYAQALGLFEALPDEAVLVAGGVMTPNIELARSWIEAVAPVLRSVSLTPPVALTADAGGRRKKHLPDLEQLVTDLQSVYRLVPGGAW